MNKVANEQVEAFTAEAKKSMEEGVQQMTKGFEDITQFGQDNVEALVASSKVVAKAAEDINAEMLAYSKKAYEDAMAASKEMAQARSVSELVEKNTAFAKSSFEGFVAQATKVNEMYSAAAKQAFTPVNARFNAASEIVKAYRV